jgi:hypothetical protein
LVTFQVEAQKDGQAGSVNVESKSKRYILGIQLNEETHRLSSASLTPQDADISDLVEAAMTVCTADHHN